MSSAEICNPRCRNFFHIPPLLGVTACITLIARAYKVLAIPHRSILEEGTRPGQWSKDNSESRTEDSNENSVTRKAPHNFFIVPTLSPETTAFLPSAHNIGRSPDYGAENIKHPRPDCQNYESWHTGGVRFKACSALPARMWITRIISSLVFLASIILSIPLGFDVGGRTCGLAFSLSLASFYFFYSVLRLATPDRSRFRYALVQSIGFTQWIILPSLLIWSLNRFSVDSDNGSGWVERTLTGKRAEDVSIRAWIFGPDGILECATIGTWDKLLRWSTPVFQLCEGFCSLLVIQAAGQITRWLVNKGGRSDSWMISLLVMSASIISSSVYFLWRVTKFPEIGNVDATLIGITITCAVFLCAWGISSGKGNPVESSLLFAYIVLCIYQIFTDYQPSNPAKPMPPPPQATDFPPLPPIIMASYTTLIHILSTLPSTIHAAFNFIMAALSTITPSVIISLAYRLFVLYASTRIIPAVRESGARALSQEASLEDSDGAGQILGLLSWFSPSILIAVYTSLLMQHFASTSGEGGGGEWWTSQGGDAGGNLWRWINVAGTMALYALELHIGKEDVDAGLTGHWKAD